MNIEILKKEPAIIDFVATFSRLEYALKASGKFLRWTKDAEADWIAFATDIESKINNSINCQLKKSIEYILNNPPQKQTNENGVIKWKPVDASQRNRTKNLIMYICRIRNNLFHGGKFVGGYLEEFDRDFTLVKCALLILKETVNWVNPFFSWNLAVAPVKMTSPFTPQSIFWTRSIPEYPY